MEAPVQYSWKSDKNMQVNPDELENDHRKMQSYILPLYNMPMPYYPPQMPYPYYPPYQPPMQPGVSTSSINIETASPLESKRGKNSQAHLNGYYHQPMPQQMMSQQMMPQQMMPPMYPYAPYPVPNYYPPMAPPQFNYSKNFFYKKTNEEDDDDNRPGFKMNKEDMKIGKKKPDPYKNKTSDQIVNEFKSFTLPKLRLKRLVKMQAVMRGYYARRFKIPKKKLLNQAFVLLRDKLLEEILEDKLVPDIVLDVITLNKHTQDYSLYSSETRNIFEIGDEIIHRLVKEIARDVVKESTQNLAQEFLRGRHRNDPVVDNNPFSLTAESIIMEFMRKQVEHLARDCVKELVNEYMIESEFIVLMKHKYMPLMIREVAEEAVDECIIESILEGYLDRMIKELVPAMYQSQYEALVDEAEDYELDWAVANHIKRGIMNVLLDAIKDLIIIQNKKEEIADVAMHQTNNEVADDLDELEMHAV